MSMDFVYDLKEKLEEQKIEYALCIMKPIKNGDTKVELFYHIENDESFESILRLFHVPLTARVSPNPTVPALQQTCSFMRGSLAVHSREPNGSITSTVSVISFGSQKTQLSASNL